MKDKFTELLADYEKNPVTWTVKNGCDHTADTLIMLISKDVILELMRQSSEPKATDVLKVRTVLDRLLIKQDEGKGEIAGIVIPDSEKIKPHVGTVMVVGPGGRDHEGRLVPMTVKVGDKVAYSEFATTTVDVDGVDYILIKEGDLLLIY